MLPSENALIHNLSKLCSGWGCVFIDLPSDVSSQLRFREPIQRIIAQAASRFVLAVGDSGCLYSIDVEKAAVVSVLPQTQPDVTGGEWQSGGALLFFGFGPVVARWFPSHDGKWSGEGTMILAGPDHQNRQHAHVVASGNVAMLVGPVPGPTSYLIRPFRHSSPFQRLMIHRFSAESSRSSFGGNSHQDNPTSICLAPGTSNGQFIFATADCIRRVTVHIDKPTQGVRDWTTTLPVGWKPIAIETKSQIVGLLARHTELGVKVFGYAGSSGDLMWQVDMNPTPKHSSTGPTRSGEPSATNGRADALRVGCFDKAEQERVIRELVFDSLLDRAGQPAWFVEDISFSNWGDLVSIRLRSQSRLGDGTLLQAPALVKAIQRIPGCDREIQSVKIIFPRVVQLQLRSHRLTNDWVSGYLDFGQPGKEQVGTGPYRVADQSQHFRTLLANPHYKGGLPSNSAILIKAYNEDDAAKAMEHFAQEKVHVLLGVALPWKDSWKIVECRGAPEARYIAINDEHPALRDRSLRRALILASSVVEAKLADTNRKANLFAIDEELAIATELVKSAQSAASSSGLIVALVPRGRKQIRAIVEQHVAVWRTIGVQVEMRLVEPEEIQSAIERRDFAIAIWETGSWDTVRASVELVRSWSRRASVSKVARRHALDLLDLLAISSQGPAAYSTACEKALEYFESEQLVVQLPRRQKTILANHPVFLEQRHPMTDPFSLRRYCVRQSNGG